MYLKKYIPGVILVGTSLGAIYYMISKTIESALQIVEKIQSGVVQPDVAAIIEFTSKQSADSESSLLDIATAVFIICWLIGIIDSYRIGCIRDKHEVLGKGQT